MGDAREVSPSPSGDHRSLPQESGTEADESATDGESPQLSAWMTALSVGVLALAAIACVWLYVGYTNGSAAADAAMAQWDLAVMPEIDAALSDYSEDYQDALIERASRGHGPFAAFDVGSSEPSDLELKIDDIAANVARDQASNDALTQAVNDLIMAKINEFMFEQQTNLNAATPALVSSQIKNAKFPQTPKQKIDGISGLETLYIDTMECYSVESDLATGSAIAMMKVAANTGPLEVRIRARPSESCKFYHLRLHVYGFRVSAPKIKGDIRFKDQAITSLNVGWISAKINSIDGTCYSKNNPSKKSGLCTSVMNKKLQKEKGKMMYDLSKQMTHQAQGFANKIMPFKLPQKATTTVAPTTKEPAENTTEAPDAAATTKAVEVISMTTTAKPENTTANLTAPEEPIES